MDNLKGIHHEDCSLSWVFFAAHDKRSDPRRALAERLGEVYPVLVVKQVISAIRQPGLMKLNKRFLFMGTQVIGYAPFHIPERIPFLGKVMRLLNRRQLANEVHQLLGHPPTMICYDSPTQHHLVGKLGERLSLYLAVDDLTLKVTGEPITGEVEAERKILSKADLVVCVSETLAEVLRRRAPAEKMVPIYVLANGFDERLFTPAVNHPEPADLHAIPRPRILVAGHISERIDWDGIMSASRQRPQWTWIFIGPADSGMDEKISGCLGNLGLLHLPVSLNEIPAWINHCDVCAVPYRLNIFTQASHPLKAIEYLAMGAPVLSTRIPSLDSVGEVVEWVEEGDGRSYGTALDRLMAKRDDPEAVEKRREAVRGDSWQIRAQQFRNIVFGIQSTKNDKAPNRDDAKFSPES
jgi:glycosyltransferase involved in cell wall biosynthesis